MDAIEPRTVEAPAESAAASSRSADARSSSHESFQRPFFGDSMQAQTPHTSSTGTPEPQRLIIVSNRLPVRIARDAVTGRWSLPGSPGGLVSALQGVSHVWTLLPCDLHGSYLRCHFGGTLLACSLECHSCCCCCCCCCCALCASGIASALSVAAIKPTQVCRAWIVLSFCSWIIAQRCLSPLRVSSGSAQTLHAQFKCFPLRRTPRRHFHTSRHCDDSGFASLHDGSNVVYPM